MNILEQKTIVIVDDEPDTTEMFAEMVRLSGYQVKKAYGSRSAMSLITQERPEAVVLDIMMPEISGLEVLRFMRRDATLAHIPVVVVSAKTLPSDIKCGYDEGASDYLTKPITYLQLKKALEKVIREGN